MERNKLPTSRDNFTLQQGTQARLALHAYDREAEVAGSGLNTLVLELSTLENGTCPSIADPWHLGQHVRDTLIVMLSWSCPSEGHRYGQPSSSNIKDSHHQMIVVSRKASDPWAKSSAAGPGYP